MSYHFKVLVREDQDVPFGELLRTCVEPRPESKDQAKLLLRALRSAVKGLQRCIREKRREFHRSYGLKLESRPPRIEDKVFYTGQWVGLVEYLYRDESLGTSCRLSLLVEPKYELFHEIYREAVEFTRRNLKPLAMVTFALPLSLAGAPRDVRLATWILEQYVESTPPYCYELKLGAIGTRLARISSRPVLARILTQPNQQLYSTIRAGLSMITRTLEEPAELPSPLLSKLLELHQREQKQVLSTLLAKPQVREALVATVTAEPDIDVLLALRAAARALPTPKRKGFARLLLIPSTKIYELYVLTKTVQALGGAKKMKGLHLIHAKEAKVYYNKPPRRLSRIVSKLAGCTPHPDILVVKDDHVVVIDAKYRLNLDRLELKEALRLLGYIADLARNNSLKAIITCITKKTDTYTAPLDGINLDLKVVEVNPTINISELRAAI